MTQRIQSERWLSLLKKVLESAEGDLSTHTVTNDETYKRALSWLDRLLAGNPLTDKQATNFITTIRARVPGKANFTWNGPIALTAKQLEDEKKFKRMDRFSKLSRQLNTATHCLMEVVKDRLETFDWTDGDLLGAFQAYIAGFDASAVQAVAEEPEPEPEVVVQAPAPRNIIDDMMAQRPRQEKFPSNTWSDEQMKEVHAAYSISGKNH